MHQLSEVGIQECSGIKGSKSKVMKSIISRGCLNPVTSTGCTSTDTGASANMELLAKFYNLGDMLNVDGDADAAAEARIQNGWNEFGSCYHGLQLRIYH